MSASPVQKPADTADGPGTHSFWNGRSPRNGSVWDVQRRVAVLEHLPELRDGLAPEAAAEASRRAVAPVIRLPRGGWRGRWDEPERFRGHLGLLVLDGLLTHSVVLEEMSCPELLGRGDVLRPWEHDGDLASLPYAARWEVIEPATIAVLDRRFAAAVAGYPEISGSLIGRAVQRSRWLGFQLAVAHVRRVDSRLLMLFWHLADRWGRVRPDGVALPLRLTHELLARLICARRPSVTVALKELAGEGRVRRESDGTWLLSAEPPEVGTVLGPSWASGN
jgi:CRP/FNR family transcriptional regulator, cyclic AMP receptor protein